MNKFQNKNMPPNMGGELNKAADPSLAKRFNA
jgi:hypothetical protein